MAVGISSGQSLLPAGAAQSSAGIAPKYEARPGSAPAPAKSDEATSLFLHGRDAYLHGDFKPASEYLEKAAALANSSVYMDWLGRAYGRRAETSGPLSAPGLALKARRAFEQAVQIDGKNTEALSDLFDFYLEAPGFLGGGYDKASRIADRITSLDPSEGHYAYARIAERRREFPSAEQHFRTAIAIAPQEVSRVITFARFLARQGRTDESDKAFNEAYKKAPDSPKLWFARADVLIQQGRNLSEAKLLLQKYVRASITVDDPPKGAAVRLLKQAGGA